MPFLAAEDRYLGAVRRPSTQLGGAGEEQPASLPSGVTE